MITNFQSSNLQREIIRKKKNNFFLNFHQLIYSSSSISWPSLKLLQYNPDRTRCSGSTERMRVIGEARIKYPIFSGPTNFYVYGSIRYCLLYATVLLVFDPIKCVKYLEAIN